jgi:dTDP-4-amino-4,6-dideoxygalactose transaminase
MSPRLFLSPPSSGPRERELVLEAMESGYIAPAGPMLERFERAFADYVGVPHALAVSSGTAAIHLALAILGVGPGDAVIASTLTFIGSVAPVHYLGATPVFVDCDRASWCIDPTKLDQAFDDAARRGLRVKAVLPTDLYGQSCDIDAIEAICAARDIPLLIDAAEAVGALYKGRHAGAGGRAAAFSFNGNKILTTSGGGMLVSQDRALIERARYLATAARQPAAHYEHTEVGFNYRLSNISAAIGLAQLESIEQKVAHRRGVFEAYRNRLGRLPGISFAPEVPGRRHTRWLTVMLVDGYQTAVRPEHIRLALEASNIEARPLWKPMHLQPVFARAPVVGGEVAEGLFASGLCLPSGPQMSAADIDRVCGAVESALGSSKPSVLR